MRVAVIGQGSIGRRHAQILTELGHEVVAFDPDARAALAPRALRAQTLEAALDAAEAAVIASPSSEHAGQARAALLRSIPVLVEKPLATDVPRVTELEQLARARGVLLAVAMNLRHHVGVRTLREILMSGSLGRVLSCRAWCGSWLPGWRPSADYRDSYSAKAASGGGALLDIAVHELDYMFWLLGPAVSVSAMARHVSKLEIDVEDVALLELELATGALAQLAVDYFDRSYHRGCRIVAEQASVHWSWEEGTIAIAGSKGNKSRPVPSDVGSTYRRQMESFIAAIRGDRDDIASASDARGVLEVIDAARSSSRHGRETRLPPAVTLRPAGEQDSDAILAWRNDPDTRRWSRTTREVLPDEHRTWFARTLADPGSRIWIGEAGSTPVGQIRATNRPHATFELHVAVAPEARGRGFGTALINEAAARLLAAPEGVRLIAHVHRENAASLRAFGRAGFEPAANDTEDFRLLERLPSAVAD